MPIEETFVASFEETFDQEKTWELVTEVTHNEPAFAEDYASATIEKGQLNLIASQDCGGADAAASLTEDVKVSSDNIVIEIEYYFDFGAMGYGVLELTINSIKIVARTGALYEPHGDGKFSTLRIEHRNGITSIHRDGRVVSEDYYTIEQVDWEGLEIIWEVHARGADCGAFAEFEVDYIGIFEIKQ
jgi:hypothetical protein